MANRSYNRLCSLALALDRVGERWTWLILQALLTGPKRFGDLQEQLPGMGSNLLAERLKSLCHNEIVRKSGKGRQSAYELTPTGEELRPIAHALILWGRHFWPAEPINSDEAPLSRPEWDMLAIEAAFNPEKAGQAQAIMQFDVSGFTFHLLIRNGECRAVTGPSVSPDVCIKSDSTTWMKIANRRTSGRNEEDKVRLKIDGDREVFNRLFEWFD